MTDPFVGTWTLNRERSAFDPNHQPASATMRWERDGEGYRMNAEGTNAAGEPVKEAPQHFILDGKEHAVPGAPGVTARVSRPSPNVIQGQGVMNGQVVGEATYEVSADGRLLTATASGMDREGRRFQTKVAFDRV